MASPPCVRPGRRGSESPACETSTPSKSFLNLPQLTVGPVAEALMNSVWGWTVWTHSARGDTVRRVASLNKAASSSGCRVPWWASAPLHGHSPPLLFQIEPMNIFSPEYD